MKNNENEKMKRPIIDHTVFSGRASKTEGDFLYIFYSDNPVDTFKKFNWTKQEYERKKKFILDKYGENSVEAMKYLDENFNEYFSKYKIKYPKSIKTSSESSKEEKKDLILDVLASGKSIGEYCAEHLYYDVTDIHRTLEDLYRNNGKEFLVREVLNSRESWTFQYELKFILKDMEDENFTIIDYYLKTKLSLYDFKRLLINIDTYGAKVLGSFIDKYSTCMCAKNYENPDKFKENKLKETYRIDNVELTEVDKNKIFSWMDENEMPYTSHTYKEARDRYLKGELIKKVKTI